LRRNGFTIAAGGTCGDGGDRGSAPPAGGRFEAGGGLGTTLPMELTLPPVSSCLPELRRTAALALRGVDDDVADEVLLALDEAVGNAIRHGSRGRRPVLVTIEVDQGWVHMTVRDHGPTAALPHVPAAPPSTLADGGRGLWLISQLVDEVRVGRWRRGVRLELRRRAESRFAVAARGA
jgi:anti-sigma regulatory factor (Ser/Thr protein kinase)